MILRVKPEVVFLDLGKVRDLTQEVRLLREKKGGRKGSREDEYGNVKIKIAVPSFGISATRSLSALMVARPLFGAVYKWLSEQGLNLDGSGPQDQRTLSPQWGAFGEQTEGTVFSGDI